jgi:hypothetical protein
MKKIINSEDVNNKSDLIDTESNDEVLLIATEPRRITLNLVGGKKWTTNEHYPQRKVLVRNRRDLVGVLVESEFEDNGNMSVVCAGDFEETDVKFDRDEVDIKVGKKKYRVIFDKELKKVWCREIDSYDYTGRVLFRNPVDKQKSEKLAEFFISLNLPKNNRNDTIANFKKNVEKFYKQEELKSQPKNQLKGNLPDPILTEAACWCIEQNPRPRYKRPTLRLAFKKFGKKSHTEGSFITMVRNKWSNILKAYDKMPDDFKKANSEQVYAKTELKIVRNKRKQRTKNDKMQFY